MAQGSQSRLDKKVPVRPYAALAASYDQFFAGPQSVWRRARRNILEPVFSQVNTVCDLACGTGVTALGFARRGRRVYAVDKSPAMCRLLRQKAKRARVRLHVSQGDMRSLRLPELVDLVTCEFHSLNHLQRPKDLARALSCVCSALRPGGYFFFDVAHAALYQGASAENRCYDSADLFSLRGYEFDRARGKAQFAATWFVRQGAGWRRFDEKIDQVPWSRRQVVKALRSAGFRAIRCHDGAEFLPKTEARGRHAWLSFYLVRKSGVVHREAPRATGRKLLSAGK